MKNTSVIMTSLLALLLILPINASAAQRIGVINVQDILQSTPKLMTQLNKLKSEFKGRNAEIVALQKKIEQDSKKVGRDGVVLSEAERNKMQDAIFSERSELRLKQEQFRRDVAKKQQAAMQQVLKQLKVAITKVAKDEGYDLVLQRDGLPYASSALDISDKVKKVLSA